MKLTFDPMPGARAAAKARINEAFGQIAIQNAHTNAVYTLKRSWATSDRSKLQEEADLRGITVDELAESILSKPDVVAEKEMERQRVMKLIDEAESPNDLTPDAMIARMRTT